MATLGDLLNARDAGDPASEADWVRLVHSIAVGDARAPHALYERAHRIVFALSLPLTRHRQAAEELTRNVFHDVWRWAPAYDRTNASVLGWILNLTRSRATNPMRFEPWATHDSRGGGPREEPRFQPVQPWIEPDWIEVAPGILYEPLAFDAETGCISMLVRLAPGHHYPPHRHGGVEELHLLEGELWIDYRKLVPGDYQRAEAGSQDDRVWSRTGCTCFLMTSVEDELR